MKKMILLLLLVCMSTGSASAAIYVDSSMITVDMLNQNPDPARPGETMEITLSVMNDGNSDLEDVTVTIEPEYPFSKVTGESLTQTIPYLNSRQDEDDAAILKYKLFIDNDAPEDLYELDIVVTDSENGGTITTTVNIDVRGKEYAQIVTITKSNIDIATEEPLEFIVTNTGNSPLKNMVISWDEESGVVLPVYSDNTKYIAYLDAGESATVSYTVMADVNAIPGLYQLDICLSFEDYDSNTNEITTKAGLFVGGETDFDVSFSESASGEVSLSVANVGNNEAYSVKVSIPEQDGYTVTGSSSTIVGNLEKGDYTITSFNIVQSANVAMNENSDDEKTGTGENIPAGRSASRSSGNELTAIIEYTDSTGQRLSVEKNVDISFTSGASGESDVAYAKNRDTSSGTSTTTYLLILGVIVAGAAVVYKKRKDREREQ
ncbi:MAG: COG1361 S-layer family protein [Methanococcoides sp.]|nr:COG1361 S-layer family protein [Methanococcoides sp.]